MLEKLANVFRVPDLRKRILFTLGLLAVYRLGHSRKDVGLQECHWLSDPLKDVVCACHGRVILADRRCTVARI